ncbi:hypothetical protein [Micromonospora endophytica]|uniref:Uncharacterized protein n=1 Tax=Micromonospora endophytica TaxID=515350 RepID=A0A2W2DYR0_9ACTN|nr:hypothetical protein [Micromonospora endophytica]PZF98023.1 hypothetical protein C1I93_10020 [Micromonospora endophytica]RIW49850.1 hypothetical protein D3H59_03570 [Micromonospora endophytica]BCJ57216.1 hypothetical protein Jiend_06380 [Micromonospora endophytica]
MTIVEIKLGTLVLAGGSPDEVPELLYAAEQALADLLAGRTVDRDTTAGAIAGALADLLPDFVRTGARA